MATTMKGELVADAADDKPGSKCLAMEQLVVQSQSADSDALSHRDDQPMYGLYRRRFVGLVGMVRLRVASCRSRLTSPPDLAQHRGGSGLAMVRSHI